MIIPKYKPKCEVDTFSGLELYELLEDFRWKAINIPKGFVTDFASFPWPFRNWLHSNDNRWIIAALVHDYLLSIGLDRRYCDIIFRVVLDESNTPKYLIYCMHAAVKIRTKYLKMKDFIKWMTHIG